MRSGETWILALVLILISGGVFTAVKAAPDMTVPDPESQLPEDLSVYDQLKIEIQPYHFGGVPRDSFSGDTTVWVVDLDYDMYSIPQANLYVTRILRKLGFSEIIVEEREAGGLIFSANFPNGQPVQIHFTSP